MSRKLVSLVRALARVPTACWVVLLVLPALVPLTRTGFFESPDGLFHAFRLAALDRAVRAGVLYPRWCPELAFGYGQPVLNFYTPLSYYLGLPFTLVGVDPFVALKIVLAVGLVASAMTMYLFARLHLDRGPALLAAVVYAYLPYHLADLYVRMALAEFLALAWFPLALWSFHRLAGWWRLPRLALAALLLTALVLTHHLSTLLFVPVLVLYVIVVALKQRPSRAAGPTVLAFTGAAVAALALSAVYWLPVAAESRWVGLATTASEAYRDQLLPLTKLVSTGFAYDYNARIGEAQQFPVGLVEAVILTAAVLPFVIRKTKASALLFLVVAMLSALMLTTASLPIWRALQRALIYLQFPWRFNALRILATAFLAGALVQSARKRPNVATCLAVTIAVATAASALWHLPYRPASPDGSVEGMWQFERDVGQVGTTWSQEYLPIWVTEQRWALSRPATDDLKSSVQLPAGQLSLTGVAPTAYYFSHQASGPASVTLHQFYYPGWQAEWQGEAYAAQPASHLGLASFPLPPGDGPLALHLVPTPAQRWGAGVSLAASLAVAGTLTVSLSVANSRHGRRRLARSAAASSLGLAVLYGLLAAALAISLAFPNGRIRAVTPADANLQDTVELLSSEANKATYRAGETVSVTLFWRALRSLDRDYKTFVHLTDAAMTRQPAQHDGDPGGGFTPVSRWLPGEMVPDTHHIPLPADLPPGQYLLWGGMYDYESVQNLQVLSASVASSDNRVLLGEIEVVGP